MTNRTRKNENEPRRLEDEARAVDMQIFDELVGKVIVYRMTSVNSCSYCGIMGRQGFEHCEVTNVIERGVNCYPKMILSKRNLFCAVSEQNMEEHSKNYESLVKGGRC